MDRNRKMTFLDGDVDREVANQLINSLDNKAGYAKFPFNQWRTIRKHNPELARFVVLTANTLAGESRDPAIIEATSRAMLGVIALLEGTEMSQILTAEFGEELQDSNYPEIIKSFRQKSTG